MLHHHLPAAFPTTCFFFFLQFVKECVCLNTVSILSDTSKECRCPHVTLTVQGFLGFSDSCVLFARGFSDALNLSHDLLTANDMQTVRYDGRIRSTNKSTCTF